MQEIVSLLPSSEKLMEWVIAYGSKLLLAIITLVVGLWLINRLIKVLQKIFELKSFEQTLQSFLLQLIGVVLKILLFISVITMVGVQMTSFIALLGAAGIAFGMALSGTLQNFAGGVMLLIFKPFKVGDYIEAQGYSGTVKEIQIFSTVLNTPDNKTIIIPNGGLSTGSMINYSAEPRRRVDWTFGISYTDSIDKARENSAPLQIDHRPALPNEILHVRFRAGPHDSIVFDRDRLTSFFGGFHGNHVGVGYDGSIAHFLTACKVSCIGIIPQLFWLRVLCFKNSMTYFDQLCLNRRARSSQRIAFYIFLGILGDLRGEILRHSNYEYVY